MGFVETFAAAFLGCALAIALTIFLLEAIN